MTELDPDRYFVNAKNYVKTETFKDVLVRENQLALYIGIMLYGIISSITCAIIAYTFSPMRVQFIIISIISILPFVLQTALVNKGRSQRIYPSDLPGYKYKGDSK